MIKRTLLALAFCLVAPHANAQATVTISNPPAGGAGNTSFSITETVWNSGTTTSAASTQTLSLIPAVGSGPMVMLGTRNVPALQSGAISTVTTYVTIPPNTQGGTYLLGAGAAGCGMNCLKSAGTIMIASNNSPSQVTVTVFVNGPGKVSGGLEGNVFQQPSFQNCSFSSGCITSGPQGSAFILTAIPGTIPASGPFGKARPATFTGWSGAGCNGMPQGSGLRVVPTTSMTCTARFQ